MSFITRAPSLDEFIDLLGYNEPTFGYKGMDYSICSPDGKFYVWAEDNPSDADLEFQDVDDMLDNWIIQGKTLREALPEIEMSFYEDDEMSEEARENWEAKMSVPVKLIKLTEEEIEELRKQGRI